MGGKDAASPRYVFTRLEEVTRHIFHPEDDQVGGVCCLRGLGIGNMWMCVWRRMLMYVYIYVCDWPTDWLPYLVTLPYTTNHRPCLQLLAYQDEDGQTIEPEYYVPVIPTVLINGSDGPFMALTHVCVHAAVCLQEPARIWSDLLMAIHPRAA